MACCRSVCVVALIAIGCFTTTCQGYRVATEKDAVQTPNDADIQFPQLSQEIKYAKLFAPELRAYLAKPDIKCTVIATDNTAIKNTMEALGEYVGLFMQNKTMQNSVFNYHVIPDKAIKAEDMGKSVTTALTRANETLWFGQRNGRSYAYFRPDYIVPLEIVNIKAKGNGCVMHIISDELLIPPTLMPTFEGWQKSAGTKSMAVANKADWAPALPPAAGDIGAAANVVASAPASAADSTTVTAAAPAGAPATSGAGSVVGSYFAMRLRAALVAIAVTVTLLLVQ